MSNKVEICGVSTADLPKLKNHEMDELMIKLKQGDNDARELFISANLRLVLSVVHRFAYKNENPDEEKRLMYVAITRAEKVLFVSSTQLYNGKEMQESEFISYLFDE